MPGEGAWVCIGQGPRAVAPGGRRWRGLAGWARQAVVAMGVGLTGWPLQAAEPIVRPGEVPPAAGACDIDVTVEPHHDAQPRRLVVTLRFDAAGRAQTVLRTSRSWAGISDFGAAFGDWQGVSDAVQVQPAPADGTASRWAVQHPPTGAVALRYSVRADLADPDDGRPQPQERLYRPQLGADWFQFFGHAVLPSLEPFGDDRSVRACITVRQPAQPQVWAFGSHLLGQGPAVSGRFTGSPALLRGAFYAGGPGWRLLERPVFGAPLRLAVRGRFDMADGAFADAAARLIDSHRRFWGERQLPPPWLVLTPNFSPHGTGGTLVHQAAVMHAGPGFSPAHPAFEFLIGHEHLHQWLPGRFGSSDPDPVQAVHGYWFSEGFTNHLTHRLLLASGLWDLRRYAEAATENLQRYWTSPARDMPVAQIAPRFFSDRDAGQQLYARGEWLAWRWDRALRARGHPGLDAVLRALVLPQPVPAWPDRQGDPGRATERLLRALAPWLGDAPRQDVARHIDQGQPVPLEADLAGPCFRLDWVERLQWTPGFDLAASVAARRVSGVAPGGPAEAAGLRDGQLLQGWSVHHGDPAREIELQVADRPGEPLRLLRYRPTDGRSQPVPRLTPRPDADGLAACTAWRPA